MYGKYWDCVKAGTCPAVICRAQSPRCRRGACKANQFSERRRGRPDDHQWYNTVYTRHKHIGRAQVSRKYPSQPSACYVSVPVNVLSSRPTVQIKASLPTFKMAAQLMQTSRPCAAWESWLTHVNTAGSAYRTYQMLIMPPRSAPVPLPVFIGDRDTPSARDTKDYLHTLDIP